MAFVYILKGNRYYIGSTTDLNRRMQEHKRGHTSTTKRIGDWELAWFKKCGLLEEARLLERKIKKWKSSRMVELSVTGELTL